MVALRAQTVQRARRCMQASLQQARNKHQRTGALSHFDIPPVQSESNNVLTICIIPCLHAVLEVLALPAVLALIA